MMILCKSLMMLNIVNFANNSYLTRVSVGLVNTEVILCFCYPCICIGLCQYCISFALLILCLLSPEWSSGSLSVSLNRALTLSLPRGSPLTSKIFLVTCPELFLAETVCG